MKEMVLSVLIPSVPSRREQAWKLFDKISQQASGHPVEILLLVDNKRRSVGKKRDALVQSARGRYVAFVDDDDDVSENYIDLLAPRCNAAQSDVILFDSTCSLNGESPVRVSHERNHPNEQYNPDGFRRSAWHIHAWRSWISRAVPFRDISNGEDWPWCEEMLKNFVRTSEKIPEVLYHYRFNSATTEASA